MPRSLQEWIGKTDDTPVPPRVRLRVLDRFGRRCDASFMGCGRIINAGDAWDCDHIQALIVGGENRESNLHPLCAWCHPVKTRQDFRVKSKIYKRAMRHAGIKRQTISRPLPGTHRSGIKLSMNGPPIWRDSGKPLWRNK